MLVTLTPKFDFIMRRISTILSVVIVSFSLLAAFTGVLLSFYYQPTAGGAYNSLRIITEQVQYGWLFRKVHDLAGNFVIGVGLIQLVVMFLGRQFRKSWLATWISGIFLILTAIGLGWTAMILDWGQIGYWRFNVELGSISSIPLIGGQLREILTGGNGVNTITVGHLYTIHSYVLTIAIMILAVAHLASTLWQEKQLKSEVSEQTSGISADIV
ncbi:cytochrome b N-terminal domain-containing protein [Calothrix sp. PCC 6303]|uniref:cytochrome b N-terminal domain-containing protein n=1 Tax=Calothrix sp. PCC 6303 TaxID=1170562 RepID=UPI0002A03C0D|nr:cytochrome b N-terminal domain-containing protein [Calothrix sp. PCC 6303]AFY99662.1 Cytochrome b/b6 domain protein [Calothrix sp. PCC 6303]